MKTACFFKVFDITFSKLSAIDKADQWNGGFFALAFYHQLAQSICSSSKNFEPVLPYILYPQVCLCLGVLVYFFFAA